MGAGVMNLHRPPLMVRCEGSLVIGHRGTFPPFLGSSMCAMCGQTYRTQDDGTVPEHDRMDVLAMFARGDYA